MLKLDSLQHSAYNILSSLTQVNWIQFFNSTQNSFGQQDNFAGRYLCSFVENEDLEAEEATDHLYIFVFDSKNLLVHSGFDFIQSVAYKSAEIPCRWSKIFAVKVFEV